MEDYNDTAAVAAEEAETASGEPDGSEKKHKRKLTAREKGKIALIVLGSFFGLIALLTVILAPIIVEGNKVITRDSAEPNDALTEWMSYISDDAPVTRLAIPGSHDSGCSGMPWYAETQDLNFAEQLARGVRYFDIRVKKKGGDLVIFHGPVNGTDYVELLYQIDEFMDAHPSEFLILDFSHFKNDSESKVFRLFDEIVSAERVVNDTCMTDSEYLDSLTLGDVRGKCVVFVDPEETEFCCRDYLFFKMGDEVEAGQEDLFSLVSPYKKTLERQLRQEVYRQDTRSLHRHLQGDRLRILRAAMPAYGQRSRVRPALPRGQTHRTRERLRESALRQCGRSALYQHNNARFRHMRKDRAHRQAQYSKRLGERRESGKFRGIACGVHGRDMTAGTS